MPSRKRSQIFHADGLVYSKEVGEDGVHRSASSGFLLFMVFSLLTLSRPIVSGIAGSIKKGGAVSIVIGMCAQLAIRHPCSYLTPAASGYPEDEDNGDWFMYTGSGGKDLKTKNRRTGEQTFDQELTMANLALAATCDAPVLIPCAN
jgi:hypothetical protein